MCFILQTCSIDYYIDFDVKYQAMLLLKPGYYSDTIRLTLIRLFSGNICNVISILVYLHFISLKT